MLKRCSRCKVELNLDQFARSFQTKDGLNRWCRHCRDERRKQLACRETVTEKNCKDCGEVRPASKFHRNNIMKDGLSARCSECHNKRYGVGTKESNERRSRIRSENWERAVVHGCKERSVKFGIPFSLTISDVIIPLFCPVLGIPLFFTKGKKTPNTPSIDRIIPELGYVASNVKVISWRANRLKLNETDPEVFDRIAAYMRSHQ